MSHRNEMVARLAHEQGGHISRRQLLDLGVTANQIQYGLRIGRLFRVYRGVYAVGLLPTNPLDRAKGALLGAGPNSVLAGWSAAAFWGTTSRWPTTVELITSGDRRTAGVQLMRSRKLLRRDVRSIDGLRVTSPARTLLDIAPHLSPERLTRVINELRHDRRLVVRDLQDIIGRNSSHSGTPLLRKVLDLSQTEHTRSQLEDAFLELLRRHGLPTPRINAMVAGYRVDAHFPDQNVIVELDGWLTHQTRHAFTRDRRQDAQILAATGIPTIRLTYEQTTRHGERTAAELRTVMSKTSNRDPKNTARG